MKDILIFLGGAMFGSMVSFLVFALLNGTRTEKDNKQIINKEDQSDV